MEEIPIEEDFLRDFLNESRNGAKDSEGSSGLSSAIESAFDKGLSWFIRKCDNEAKEKGLPGLEDMRPEEVGELITIVLEKHFGTTFKKYTPEGMLALVLVGTFATNMIAYKRLEIEQATEDEESSE